jgi:hypothetical protein
MAEAGLILDRRTEMGAAPGLHAIFIGISDYAKLTHPEEDVADEGMAALQKLRSPALSAFRMKEQFLLLDQGNRLFKPLKTVRFLTAPMPEEIQNEPRLATDHGDLPVFATLRDAIRNWRRDIAVGQDEQGLFQFSGHGVRIMGNSAILLAADFDPAGEVLLENAFDFQNIFFGMAPNSKYPDIGRTQFYFVDACRNKPDILKEFEDLRPSQIFDVRSPDRDDRKAPVAYAATNGGHAAAIAGQCTEFIDEMLWALDSGSVSCQQLPGNAKSGWPISFDTMKLCLNARNLNAPKRFEFSGLGAETLFTFRRDPPEVDVQLSFVPDEADQKIGCAKLVNGDTNTECGALRGDASRFWQVKVPSGLYRLSVEAGDDSFPKFQSMLEPINLGRPMPWTVTLGGGT